jgi:hypothetical protein
MDGEVQIRVSGAEDGAASLMSWLLAEVDLRGRIRLDGSPPPSGSLGAMTDVLTVAVGAGGSASVLASALVAWIRRRSGNTVIRVTRPDGSSIELEATEVRGLTAEGIAELVHRVNESLADRPGQVAAVSTDDE